MGNTIKVKPDQNFEMNIIEMAIECGDKDVSERGEGIERILLAVWRSAYDIQESPLHVARSLPFDVLLPPEEGNTTDAAYLFFDQLFSSPLITDSNNRGVTPTPECLQFIYYYLPGQVKRDHDGTPVAAELWNTMVNEWTCKSCPFVETARNHPKDDPYYNYCQDLLGLAI